VKQLHTVPPFEQKILQDYKNKLTKAELTILKTLQFNIEVDLPHDHLQVVIESLYEGLEDNKILLNIANSISNESMRSVAPMCLPVLPVSTA
jgi:hypothetical protein